MTTIPAVADRLRERLARLDSAALADALDSLHAPQFVLPGIRARVPGAVACGPAFTVRYRTADPDPTAFRNAADYIDDVPAGSVVVVDNHGSRTCTTWGSLLTTMAGLRGLAGTVVHGSLRDVRESRELGYPLFSTDVTMVSGKNRVVLDETGVTVDIAGTEVAPGDWVFADDNGALRIPAALVEEVVTRAEAVDRTETRIRAAAERGSRLDAARARFGYARPWEAADRDDHR
ncbi:RraA family protein [Streptomyces sp. VRA16 Mangrove soil]|uniref:RraA family protein n=1 Tax=Streptomyces sp. VRA16 Mangrove soil TaxID=2817434 RepID=UPI001A9F563B|nr:RraA family protein [Streptomyces sp. VRA16 Mangrove soil]MBO1337176.1 RraA family protein [Streptomyces sp. VRA16 Mangrove soil]